MLSASIDNLTVVADATDDERVVRVIQHVGVKNTGVAKYPYRRFWSLEDGSYVAYADDREQDNVPKWRVEFNPNKCVKECVGPVLERLSDGRFTRTDLAVDYREMGINLGEMQFLDRFTRSRELHLDRSGRIETLYIGAGGGRERIRVYNKAVEEGLGNDVLWWRAESQQRFGAGDYESLDHIVSRAFLGLKVGKLALNDGMDVRERAMLFFLQHHPEYMGAMCSSSRSKYRKLMDLVMETISPDPGDVIEGERMRLVEELRVWKGFLTS